MISNPTKALGWPLSEKVLRLFLGTALTLLIARQIGPAAFGMFSTVFAIFILFSSLAGLGLKDVIVDEIASGRQSPQLVLSTAAAMTFAASFVSCIGFLLLIIFLYPGYGVEFWVSFILSMAFLLKGLEVLLFGLEARADLRSIAQSQQSSLIATAIGKILILLFGATIISFAAVITFEFTVLYVAATVVYASRHNLVLTKHPFHLGYAVNLLNRSWPLAVSSLAVIGYFYVDQIMIALLMDTETVGVYAAASRISQQLYILPTVLVAAYYPRLTHVHTQSSAAFNEGFKDLSVVLIVLSIVLCATVILLSDSLLPLILGPQFAETATILKMHSLGLVLVSVSVISGRWYVMHGLQKLTLMRQLLTAIINILLNLLLIPILGAYGAVYATLLSLLFLAFGFDHINAHTHPLAKLKLSILGRLTRPSKIYRSFYELVSI